MFKFYSDFTGENEGYLYTNTYLNNGNLYIGVMGYDEEDKAYEPYCSLTTNIVDLPDNMVALDTNNNSGNNIIDVLINEGVLVPTGHVLTSGFCTYPVCEVTDKLKDFCEGVEA